MKSQIYSGYDRCLKAVICWFDSENHPDFDSKDQHKIDWLRCTPFLFLHLACIGVVWVGVSMPAIVVCLGFFWLRMFAITAFYHRLFSHRSYKTNRFWQFCFAVLGNSACQRGPLWWAAHHRSHHKHSDSPLDLHSPVQHGFWFSHVGWFMCNAGFKTNHDLVKDLNKFPELRFLNRFDTLVPALFAVAIFLFGEMLAAVRPQWQTDGWQMLVWGFFVSTVLLFHATFTINSLGHLWGSRRFKTKDDSRNNPWFALLTLGEGWHNNHHRFAVSARQGFYWWEVDVTYYLLKILQRLGIVRDLNPVPSRILAEGRLKPNKHLGDSRVGSVQ